MKRIILSLTLIVATSTANAALVSRLGGLAYYDDVADLTWLQDASAAGTIMNWVDANAWAMSLNVSGVTGWRLPDTMQPDPSCELQNNGNSSGANCTGSEMVNLFYNVLGGVYGRPISMTHSSNYDLFSNIVNGIYWTATEHASFPDMAWIFSTAGSNNYNFKTLNINAWAVHTGDVSAVPVPAAVWLFGSGLVGLIGAARRKRTAS